MYKYSLSEIFSSELTMLPARVKGHPTNPSNQVQGALFGVVGQRCPRDPQSIMNYVPLTSVALQRWTVSPIAENTMHFRL